MRTLKAQQRFDIDVDRDEHVPAILQVPSSASPVPAVLLLHGFSSHKERMAESIGTALFARGVASLAIDLPSHGARERALQNISMENPMALIKLWKLAMHEAAVALEYLAAHPDVDARRIAIGGYSLGAYLGLFLAARSDEVRAVALVAGGDLPQDMPMERIVRAAVNPQKAVRALHGRPLLMMNGRGDRTIKPEWAKTLFEHAQEPKELRWYSGGHWPPPAVIDEVTDWLAAQL
ncbi:MAG: dipeptidyl aminopeptidase/acylaminoacyl-peptidase-like protein [Gemmatimonadetes bacterium]|nr:dipeptidyl aminopeptidase/acylaminoacyl-peptidase-like protein [Gemmatimonadota bacterium]